MGDLTGLRCGTGGGAREYSVPGVLEFIQSEWRKFEVERTKFEAERALLKATIARLEGELKGGENVRKDLLRRLKMLEYALQQERKKRLLGEGDPSTTSPSTPLTRVPPPHATIRASNPSENVSRCWALVQEYLDQIDLPDNLLSLPLLPVVSEKTEPTAPVPTKDATSPLTRTTSGANYGNLEQGSESNPPPTQVESQEPAEKADSTPMLPDWTGPETSATKEAEGAASGTVRRTKRSMRDKRKSSQRVRVINFGGLEEAMRQAAEDGIDMTAPPPAVPGEVFKRKDSAGTSPEKRPENMGELADIQIEDTEPQRAVPTDVDASTFRLLRVKYVLRSHLDGVRSIAFHTTEPVLVSGSEDSTVKFWNLRNVTTSGKKTLSTADVEPIVVLRGHTGPVFSVALSVERDLVASAGADATVRLWSLPSAVDESYTSYGTAVCHKVDTYVGHSDSIWDVLFHPVYPHVISACADGTVKVWDITKDSPLVQSLSLSRGEQTHTPTSIAVLPTDVTKIVVSYDSSLLAVFDLPTGSLVSVIDGLVDSDATAWLADDAPEVSRPCRIHAQINKIAVHPTLPLVITAHEDKYIKFFDFNSGLCVHSMLAHLDAVSSVSVDPTGMFLCSGGHDSSLRVWDIGKRTCVQELSTHRPKYDESIHCVAYHPSRPIVGSAGADSIIKIYQ